jgi:hypothetical protein
MANWALAIAHSQGGILHSFFLYGSNPGTAAWLWRHRWGSDRRLELPGAAWSSNRRHRRSRQGDVYGLVADQTFIADLDSQRVEKHQRMRPTGSCAAKIVASTRCIYSRQRASGGR